LERQSILWNELPIEIDFVKYQTGQGEFAAESGTGRSDCR